MKKDILIVVCIAFVLRLAFSFVVAERVGPGAFEDVRPMSDAGQYIALTKNILDNQTFTLYGEPHSFRTPGYPAFLAFWYWLSGSWFFSVAVVGSALGALSAGVTYIIGRELFSRTVGLLAGAFFAFEPYGAHMAARPMTESVYTILVALLAFFIVRFYRSSSKRAVLYIFLSGLVVGLAVWVRPQLWPFYVFPMTLVVFLTSRNVHQAKTALLSAVLFIGVAALVIVPWIVRNAVLFGEPSISSQGGWNLYFYHTKRFTGSERFFGLENDEIRRFLEIRLGKPGPDDIRSIVYQPIYYTEAFNIILQRPASYAFWHIKESLVFFYDDGIRDVLRHMGAESSFTFESISAAQILKSPTALLALGGVAFWIGVFLLAGYGAWQGIWKGTPVIRCATIFFLLTILYVPFVAGTLAVASFRFPLTPMIFPLFGFGLCMLWERLKWAV